jgi:phosphate transport system substrate-binding protein
MLWSDVAVRFTLSDALRGKLRPKAPQTVVAGALVGALLLGATPSDAASRSSATTYQQSLSGTLTVGGSTALEPLVQRAATNFQKVNSDAQIAVSGGGSGAGRAGVCQGSLDVGLSDVPLASSEMKSLNCSDAVQTAIALDAFAVVANPSGPGELRALNREEMQHIFSGDVQNWADIQGVSQPLVVINRVKGSGTRQSMANYLFNGDDSVFGTNAADQDDSQQIVNTLSQTPGAISYLGLAYLNSPDVMTLGIQGPDGTIVMPTRDVVASNQWPIGGPGQAITRGQPGALAAAFLDYLVGPEFASDPAWTDLGLVQPVSPAIGNQYGR